MTTMVDLERACRAAGLPMDPTVPDFLTNGHNGVRVLAEPRVGYWHHTDSTVLQSVYTWDGQDEWRPDVPSPRCNMYAARARPAGCGPHCRNPGRAHLVPVSAGVAYHAGTANLGRIQLARAGRVNAALPDAAGLPDDYGAANGEAVGLEVDWRTGEGWPADLLDLVASASAVAVGVFGWPGVGSWIHHRQATHRKPDMAYRGDLWARTRQALDGGDDMPLTDTDAALIWKHPIQNPDPDSLMVMPAWERLLDIERTVAALRVGVATLGARTLAIQAAVGAQADDERVLLAAVRAGDTALEAAVAKVAPASGVDPAALRAALTEALATIRATTTLGTA